MKNRLTKFFTVFLTVMLCVGMMPATGSTAYAASKWSSGSSISSWFTNLFGGSSNNDSSSNSGSSQAGENDANLKDSNQLANNVSDETGTADDITLSKKAIANGTRDGKPAFDIQLGVQGKEVKKGAPVDFTLVIDLSNSMNDTINNGKSSLAITKEAAISFIDTVLADGNDNVRIALVVYGAEGYAYNFASSKWDLYGKLESNGYYTSNKAQVSTIVNNIEPKVLKDRNGDLDNGGTNTEAGFLTTKEVTETRNSTAMSRVVFMTDGLPTYHYNNDLKFEGGGAGTISEDFNQAVEAGNALKKAGNDIYTVGLLTSYNGDIDIEMANNLLSDKHSYFYSDDKSSYTEITTKTNEEYFKNRNNLWMEKDGSYVKIGIVEKTNDYGEKYYWYYDYSIGAYLTLGNGNKFIYYETSDPGLTLYTKIPGYEENGEAYSTKYYPITDADKAANQIKDIYTSIAKESLVLATGDIVDYIPEGFTVDEASVKAAGGSVIKDSNGKITAVKFTGVPAGKEVTTKTFTLVYTGDKYGVAYTNTEATYSGTLYDGNTFSKVFPLPVVGLNPATEDDEYYLDPNTDSNLAILGNDTLNKIAEDGYSISDLQVTLSNVPEGVTARVEQVDGQYVVVFNGPAGDYTFDYVITATATKGDTSVGLPAENQDGWNDGKTQFTITSRVTNVKVHIVAAATQAFIVDFGKPVTYDADKVFTKSEQTATITLPETKGTYGNMALNSDKSITYTLTKFMDGIDKFTFNEDYNGKKQLSKDVYMVPASSIYYEDNFADEDGNTLIQYGEGWSLLGTDTIPGVAGDGNLGYDSAYDTSDSQLVCSGGTIHYVPKSTTSVKAEFTFKGQGIDLYSYTSGNTGKFTFRVYDKDGTRVFNKTITTKYNSGNAYQVPVVTFMGDTSQNYKVEIIVPKNEAFYLDAVRIYNSVKVNKDDIGGVNVDNESSAKFVSIREQSLLSDADLFIVKGSVFIDAYLGNNAKVVAIPDKMTEYTTYGRKTEVVLAPKGSITITLKDASQYSKVQLGARIDAAIPSAIDGLDLSNINTNGKVSVNGEDINIKSSTDMYYTVKVDNGKIVVTNNTNKLLALTKLKLVK